MPTFWASFVLYEVQLDNNTRYPLIFLSTIQEDTWQTFLKYILCFFIMYMYNDHKTDFHGLFSVCLFHVYTVYVNCNHFIDYKAKLHNSHSLAVL